MYNFQNQQLGDPNHPAYERRKWRSLKSPRNRKQLAPRLVVDDSRDTVFETLEEVIDISVREEEDLQNPSSLSYHASSSNNVLGEGGGDGDQPSFAMSMKDFPVLKPLPPGKDEELSIPSSCSVGSVTIDANVSTAHDDDLESFVDVDTNEKWMSVDTSEWEVVSQTMSVISVDTKALFTLTYRDAALLAPSGKGGAPSHNKLAYPPIWPTVRTGRCRLSPVTGLEESSPARNTVLGDPISIFEGMKSARGGRTSRMFGKEPKTTDSRYRNVPYHGRKARANRKRSTIN